MKKQNWIKENWMSLTVIILIFFIFYTFLYSKTDKYICFHHPEKCVCEETKGMEYKCEFPYFFRTKFFTKEPITIDTLYLAPKTCFNGWTMIGESKECKKFRLKTQAELDIDDCNNNPREDEKCKCEEIKCSFVGKVKGYYITSDSGCVHLYEKLSCTKSRPKTECEKENPKFEQITDCTEYGCRTNQKYSCFIDISLDNAQACDGRFCPLQSDLFCKQEQTICREKSK